MNKGKLKYVRILRLGIGGIKQKWTIGRKISVTHLTGLARNESYDDWYVPQNCKITVEQENERDPSSTDCTVVRVRPEMLDFAGEGERIVVIKNRYK